LLPVIDISRRLPVGFHTDAPDQIICRCHQVMGAGMAFSTLGKLAVHASRDAEQPWADLSSSDFYNPRPGWQLGNKLRLRKVSIAKGANNI